MSDYTPTTDQVREWALHGFGEYKDLGSDWFDRWLRDQLAQAWSAGAYAALYATETFSALHNPYRDKIDTEDTAND